MKSKPKIHLAADHAGYSMKESIKKYLERLGYDVVDHGNTKLEPKDDYPDYVYPAAVAVVKGKTKAIVFCGSGYGACIVANKVKGARAALVYDLKSAYMSRRHNDSNILVLPSCLFKASYYKKIVSRWLLEEFEGGRHARRLRKIRLIEDKENT